MEGLKPNTEYSFSLAAISNKGIGAFTNELVQRTSQASMSEPAANGLYFVKPFPHADTSCSSERAFPASRAAAAIFTSLHLSPLSTLPPLIHPDRAFPPAFSLWLPHTASADLSDGVGAPINTFALPFLHHSSGLSAQ